MIAKSDLVILVVSASALAVGVARWQINMSPDVPPRMEAPAAPVAPLENSEPDGAEPVLAARPLQSDTVSRVQPQPSVEAAPDPNQRVVEPLPAPAPSAEAQPPSPSPVSGEPLYGIYDVVAGDNLTTIAARVGTSVDNLLRINNLEGTTILVGQELRYPQAAN